MVENLTRPSLHFSVHRQLSLHQNMSPSTLNYLTLSNPYPPFNLHVFKYFQCMSFEVRETVTWNSTENECICKSFGYLSSFCQRQNFDQFCLRTSAWLAKRPPKAIQGHLA